MAATDAPPPADQVPSAPEAPPLAGSGISQSTGAYFESHPALKYVFFGGKGGVGKTVMAGATALWHARQGRRTLLASTNPVHSLSSLLGQNVFGRHTPVSDVENLWAYEIDTRDTIERSKRDIKDKIQWFLKFAEISTKADEFVESATMNPAFEESAMFENMIDLMFRDEYDAYVFDTAPTANARRLLGMSKVYSLWVNKMLKSREEARSLREMLSFRKKKEEDPLMDYLLSFRERMEHARVLLTDPQRTAFFFVTLPEALPIAVITRFIAWFHDFGIPVGGVVVNMRIEPSAAQADTAEFVRNRVAMQTQYMDQIWEKFDGNVRAVIPLFETEIRGVPSLARVAEELFVPAPATPAIPPTPSVLPERV
jgi:arsenite-transporting ATPase